MKRFLKILKWTGIILVILIAGVSITVAARQHRTFEAPYPNIKASTDSAVIAHGRHIVLNISHCADCHTNQNVDSMLSLGQDPELSGGKVFDFPLGKIYTRNITPDDETGIGKHTDAEIARLIYYSVGKDNRGVFNFMQFHNMSEEDMTAVVSYLRTQKPVKNVIPQNSFTAPGKFVNAFLLQPVGPSGPVLKSVPMDTTAVYGSYLVNSLANCGGCHTKMNPMTGETIGKLLEGGNEFDEGGEKFVTPNITGDTAGRIRYWTFEDFKNRFRMGKTLKNSPMPWNSFKRMTDTELKAIYSYLKTVKNK